MTMFYNPYLNAFRAPLNINTLYMLRSSFSRTLQAKIEMCVE